MLREIIAITGKPGLYKIVSHSASRIIVEDMTSKKRFPVSSRDKVVSLGDIAMYTDGDDKPLGEILDLLYAKQEGNSVDIKALDSNDKLSEAFAGVLENYDRERVYASHIKKLFAWYNLLIAAGMTKFTETEE